MKGIILDEGLISGEDGQRYAFGEGDVKNASEQRPAAPGASVDFRPDGECAREIYILAPASAPTASASTPDGADAFELGDLFKDTGSIATLRARAICAICALALGNIPGLGIIIWLLALFLYMQLFRQLERESCERGFVRLVVAGVLLSILAGIITATSAFVTFGSGSVSGFLGIFAGCALGVAAAVCFICIDFKFARATGVQLFRTCGYLRIFSWLPLVGVVLCLAACVCEIIAWTQVKKLVK